MKFKLTGMVVAAMFSILPVHANARNYDVIFKGHFIESPDNGDNLGIFGGGSMLGKPLTIDYRIYGDNLSNSSSGCNCAYFGDFSTSDRIDAILTLNVNSVSYTVPVYGVGSGFAPAAGFQEIINSGVNQNTGYDSLLFFDGSYDHNNAVYNELRSNIFYLVSGISSNTTDFIPSLKGSDPGSFSIYNPQQSLYDPNVLEVDGPYMRDSLNYTIDYASASDLPEAGSWIFLIFGFGAIGWLTRRRRAGGWLPDLAPR